MLTRPRPFKLAKDPAQAQRLDEVLYNLAETCRILAVLLWPFLPGTATKIYSQLGLNPVEAGTGQIFQRDLGRIKIRPHDWRTCSIVPRKDV